MKFEGIRILILFEEVEDFIKIIESMTPLTDRVKDSNYGTKSRTSLMEKSQRSQLWVELRTPINLVVKEYLYDNVQIRFKS